VGRREHLIASRVYAATQDVGPWNWPGMDFGSIESKRWPDGKQFQTQRTSKWQWDHCFVNCRGSVSMPSHDAEHSILQDGRLHPSANLLPRKQKAEATGNKENRDSLATHRRRHHCAYHCISTHTTKVQGTFSFLIKYIITSGHPWYCSQKLLLLLAHFHLLNYWVSNHI
jgi:hypothetical protein